ncbi:MAG: DUF305 domain-containing protein [Pyrinomonadaceae bacterium]
MNTKTILIISLTATVAMLATACGGTANVNVNPSANTNRNAMNSSMPTNASNMPMNANSNMSGMMDMKSSPDAAKQPYDLQFIDTMTHHHQGALDMAKMALAKTTNDELKKFVRKIVDDQTKEIGQMKEWRDKWYAGKPMAMNMEMPGMMNSMKMMSGDEMKHLQGATGNDFDVDFLDMMTPHHEGAITMAKDALTKAEHAEVKTLSNQIIKAQESEIKQMSDWKAKWSK